MITSVTEGIKVSVKTTYQPEYSEFSKYQFVFTYRITIENNSDYTIQLLKRHWEIFDANGIIKEVKGKGVVGQQPILEPGEKHQYVSGCNLEAPYGKMEGKYIMERLIDGKSFTVNIPEFSLIAPFKLN